MAAKIVGNFIVDENSFPFTGIAFGRIGGQNIGVKLTEDVEKNIKDLGYDLDVVIDTCLLYTSPSPRDATLSRMPSSA